MWFSLSLLLALLPILVAACLYTAATRTRAITYASVVFLKAVLRLQKVIVNSDGCAVEPCPGGILLKDVVVPDKILELTSGSVTIQSVSIKRLHLLWTTSASPLMLCISGASVRVRQRRTAPKVQPNARPMQHHSGKLNALEALLWDGRQNAGMSGWRGRQLQLLRFLIALVLRNMSVLFADAELQYLQTGDPGPVPEPSETRAVDAVVVTVRTIEVSPMANPSSGAPAIAAQSGLECAADAAVKEPHVDPDAQRVASPPPEVQRRLHRWRDVSGLFPRVQALYSWFNRFIIRYHPLGDCDAARVSVAGVNVLLMSQMPQCMNLAMATTKQQEQPQRHSSPARPSGLQRLRGRPGIPGRVSPMLARVPTATATGKPFTATATIPEWAYMATVLRQWSMQVDVYVGSRLQQGSSQTRAAARTCQPLALHVHGSFGIRGQQRSVDGLSSVAQHDPTGSSSSSLPRRTVGLDVQTSASTSGVNRRTPQPSNLSRSSRTAAQPALRPHSSPARGSQEAVSTQNSGRSASGPTAGLIVHVDIVLKALVPELEPEGVTQLLRMTDRVLTYDKYSIYWSRRPSVSVTQSPAAWWQHAGRAIINVCREHFPLQKVRVMMARRAEYIRVYKEFHSMQRGFHSVTYLPQYEISPKYQAEVARLLARTAATGDIARQSIGRAKAAVSGGVSASQRTSSNDGHFPSGLQGSSVPGFITGHQQDFPLRRVVYVRAKKEPNRLAQLVDRLAQLESQLPLGQIICNRIFVALWHSARLARSNDAKARWLETMGVISNFVDAIPIIDEEEEDPGSNSRPGYDSSTVDRSSQGVDPAAGRVYRASAATQISLGIDCPRLGVKLINKHWLDRNFSTSLGSAGAKVKLAAPSTETSKRPADVLAIMLEGIRFIMPDIYRFNLQAATIKASLLGCASGGPKHVLIVPSSRECAEEHGTKLDFSAASASHTAAKATDECPHRRTEQSWVSEESIYLDAPISRYLSRYKVHIAAVEVALSSPPFVVACARFLDSIMRLKAASPRKAEASNFVAAQELPATSLHALVMDSYTRNRIRVPSSMAAFMPKLQFFCPMVSARWMLAAAHTPSVGGISKQHSEVLTVVVVTNLRIASRYVHTCYSSLVQSASAQAHLEMYFQVQPRSDSHLVSAGAVASGICKPQLGQFSKMWLDPDDVELVFPWTSTAARQDITQLQEASARRHFRIVSRVSNGTVLGSSLASLPAMLPGFSEFVRPGRQRPQVSFPFLPLLKVRSFSALALNQVPYEPAVPGTMTTHQTVGVHSAIAWFSPWHAMAINAAIDSLLTHPVLANLRSLKGQPSGGDGASDVASSTAAAKDLPWPRQPSSNSNTEGVSAAAGGSSISVLLDVPLFTVNCYAEMPRTFSSLEGLDSKLQAMQDSGSALQLSAWVTKRLATKEQRELAGRDPVLLWGLRLAPLLTVNLTNIRSGLRLTRRNCILASLQTTGLQVSDHQARLKRSLYAKVWLANSGKGSDGPAVKCVQGLLPEDNTSQLLGPLATRAAAVRTFARDRRRAALCLPLYLSPAGEQRGQIRQHWRRLLEVQLLYRASDFAMFLLSPTHRSAAQLLGALPQPLESYRMLFQDYKKEALSRSCSSAALTSPSDAPMPSPFSTRAVEHAMHGGQSTLVASSSSGYSPSLNALGSIAALFNSTARRASHLSASYRKSTSTLGSIAALFSPGGRRVNHVSALQRQATSVVQALGAVQDQRYHHFVTLKHSAALTSALRHPTGNSSRASSSGGDARPSMDHGLEDNHFRKSSLRFVSQEPDGVAGQHYTGSDVAAAAAGLYAEQPAILRRNESGRSRSGGGVPSGDGNGSGAPDGANPLHSAFGIANTESRVAAQGFSYGSQSSISASSDAGAKLSFVQAFRHLCIRSQRQQRVVYVYNMPLPSPVLTVVMGQALANHEAATVTASCQHIISCVGVHSVGSILHMLVQIEQAMRSTVRSGKQSSGATRASLADASSPGSARYKATLNMQMLKIKIILEEPSRRLLHRPTHSASAPEQPHHVGERKRSNPVDKERRGPGLTELTSIELSELSVRMLPDPRPEGPAGLNLQVEVRDVIVLDLQGCVEHRNVLVAKPPSEPPGSTSSLVGQLGHSFLHIPGTAVPDPADMGDHPWRIKLEYHMPPKPDVPGFLKVTLLNQCVTWLRRYSNNLLYAIGIITAAHRSAVQDAAAALSPLQPPPQQSPADLASVATSSSGSLPPVILVEALNLEIVLPGGAAASHGPIRRAVHNEAVSLETRSVAVCIPGGVAALHKLVDLDAMGGNTEWMTSPEDVYGLISSSLSLGDRHFPQLNKQARPDDRLHPDGCGDQGEVPGGGIGRRQRKPTAAANASSPSNCLQKHLQAAKATFIDPLKEILQEAGHKRTKKQGELGVVLIDENVTTCTTDQINPGYLRIDDPEARFAVEGAAVTSKHTTTTVHAASPQLSSRPHSHEVEADAKRQPEGSSKVSAQQAGQAMGDSSSVAAHGPQTDPASKSTDISQEFPPLVLISVSGFTASSGKLVPYDDCAYGHRRCMPQRQASRRAGASFAQQQQLRSQVGDGSQAQSVSEAKVAVQLCILPAKLVYSPYDEISRPKRKLVECDAQVESALYLLADTELQSVHQLIEPVQLKGAVFNHKQHSAVQVHFSAVGAMVARLGPQRYERLMKVLTDNITEAYSCFNVGATLAANVTQRHATFAPNAAFAPQPGQLPHFHLTVEWLDQFRVVLESDPAWWKAEKAAAQDVEPCLEACFNQCSLGLMMMQKTNDMFLAFYSQQLYIADVRVKAHAGTSDVLEALTVDGFDGRRGTSNGEPIAMHMRADPTRSRSGEGAISKRSNATASGYCDDEDGRIWMPDGDSTDTPDGQNVQPVVDDQLRHIFPGRPAVVTLLRSNLDLPADEAAHLAAESTSLGDLSGSGECPRDNEHNCVRVSFAMMQDGTMANEIELCHTLVQWPYLSEMSLISSIIAIFIPTWGQPQSGPEALLRLSAAPWFYFNLLLRNSQVYLPVLAPHLRHLTYGWRAAAAEAAGEDIHLTPENLQKLFATMVDDECARNPSRSTGSGSGGGRQPPNDNKQPLMARPQQGLVSNTGGPGVRKKPSLGSPLGDPELSCNWATLSMRQMPGVTACEEQPKRLEQMGLAITMAALRFGYFSGGDGDSILKIDLRNSAGFMRHSSVQVTNWLLPIRSLALEHHCKTPLVDESQVLQKYIAAARKLVFQIKRMRRNKAEKQKTEAEAQQGVVKSSLPNDAEGVSVPALGGNGDDLSSIRSRAKHSTGATSALDLLVEQATLRAAGLLELHKLPLPTSSAALVAFEKLLARHTSENKIVFEMDTAIFRASFSNIPVWHAMLDDVSIAMGRMGRNNCLFPPAPALERWTKPRSLSSASEAAAEMRATWKFRPSYMSVHANVKSLGFVLCDDKPKSYGAPDVLTAAMEQVAVQYNMAKRYYDHLPEQSGCVCLRLASQFLNNSTGRWEHLLEPWPAELHLSDPINPVFKTSRTKYIFVSSSELMKLTFHPSCLLTLGDTLSFVRRISERHQVATASVGLLRGGTAAPVAEDPPSIEEQMALSGSIMTRVPQRYLIQNMTGLMMSYWSPRSDNDVQPASNKRVLPSGCSEELQVTPKAKQVKIVGPGGVVVTRLQAQVIVLNFEGSWMPITDVSVDVVGKYCYELHSPTDDRRAPVIVDVALVGRTKILKIHSALFVQNDTNCRLSFRLHFPSVLLARQVVQVYGDIALPGEQDIHLRTLNPGEGRYLPVVAALGGTLYLEARTPHGKGWCKYQAAQHDVIRLFPSVSEMTSQAGFIATGSPMASQMGLYGSAPLHFAVKVRVRTRTEYSYTTFHSMEVPGPGLFAKACRPLEASIKICPTIVLTNSLPYYMEGYLISLNGSSREFDAAHVDMASNAHVAPKPVEPPSDLQPRCGSKSILWSGPPPSESRRLMRVRRSETVEETHEVTDIERIISEFDALMKLLKPKEMQLRKINGFDKMPLGMKKCHMLAALRCELRWAVKRNVKEMELLMRTDAEPSDRITWQELDAFIDWAKQSVRLVHVPPGETQPLYLDMQKQVVICMKVPELHLQCTRPVEINRGSSTTSSGNQELPDFMRLDYTESDAAFSKVLADMKSRNRIEPSKPLLQVVNQKFQDTAAAVGDRVANTVDKMANSVRDAIDAFSGPYHGKLSQSSLPPAPPSPCRRESLEYWLRNEDKLVRVKLIVRPGPWQLPNTCPNAGTSCGQHVCNSSGGGGASSGGGAQPLPVMSSSPERLTSNSFASDTENCTTTQPTVVEQSGEDREAHVLGVLPSMSQRVEPVSGLPLGDTDPPEGSDAAGLASIFTGHELTGPVPSVVRQPIATEAPELEKSEEFVAPADEVVPEQHVASSPAGAEQSDAPSSSLGMPPVRSVFGLFRRVSVVGRLHDEKSMLPGRPSGSDIQGRAMSTCSPSGQPPITERVYLRLSYRPDAVVAAAPASGWLQTYISLSRPASRSPRNGSMELASLPTLRPRSSESSRPATRRSPIPVIRLHLSVLPATPSTQEAVRVRLLLSPPRTEPQRVGPWEVVSRALRRQYGATVQGDVMLMDIRSDTGAVASPVSGGVHHSSPVSPVLAPGTSSSTSQLRQTARQDLVFQQSTLSTEVATTGATRDVASILVASSGGASGVDFEAGTEAADRGYLRQPAAANARRSEAFWSVNAAFKCGSSVSTMSGSDMPTRAHPGDLQQFGHPLKSPPAGRYTRGSWQPGDASREPAGNVQSTFAAAAADSAVESDSSRPSVQLGSQAAVIEQLSAAQIFFDSQQTKLSEGYAQLELFNATVGSVTGRTRSARRSSTLSVGSPTLRRVPIKFPRSAGSLESSTVGSDGGGSRRGPAPVDLARAPEGSPVGQVAALSTDTVSSTARPEASPAAELQESSFATIGGVIPFGGSRNVPIRGGEGDLPAISETANPANAPEPDMIGSLTAMGLGKPESKQMPCRRWTADDAMDNAPGCEDTERSTGASRAEAYGASSFTRKSHSDKRVGDRVYGWHFRSRAAGRLQQASLGGIGKKGSTQPSYRSFMLREGRIAPNPMSLAKSAMQAMPRLPSLARSMGGKIVDGGQQVIHGVPHVALKVADTIIAGSQGVKEKVVESTEQAIKIAKPKIRKGLLAIAWKATEAMRKRKQGADGLAIYANIKPSLRGKHKNGQEHAPKVLMLSLHNSLATKEDEYVCRLTLYAPFWVDNRTGLYLMFKDLDAPAGLDNLPFLIWHPVRVPGDKAGHLPHEGSRERASSGASTPHLDRRSLPSLMQSKSRRDGHGVHAQKPSLLNDQTRTRFCVQDHGHGKTEFCVAFTIATINQKYSIDIRGEKEKVASTAQEKVNGAESPTTFSGRSSAQTGQVQLQTLSIRDGVSQRESEQIAVNLWPRPQSSSPVLTPLGSSPVSHKQSEFSWGELSPKPQADTVQHEGDTDERFDAEASSRRRNAPAVVLRTEESEAHASSHAVCPIVTAAESQQKAMCPEPPGWGLPPVPGTELSQPLQDSEIPQNLGSCEIVPVEGDDGKGPPMTSLISAVPLPDIPEHGALGTEMPSLLSLCTSNKDAMGLDCQKSRGSGPSVDVLGNHLSSASADPGPKGRKRVSRQGSSHGSVDRGLDRLPSGRKELSQVYVRRLYQFAVEIWAAPNDTVFGRTKVITVKNKYLILNATGLLIEYKQKGTPDPSPNPSQGKYGETRRFSRRLPHNSSASWHWDNADAEQELMIRPAADNWEWSGSFKLPEVEDYFGLRIRHCLRNEYVIIPVNITVGAAGSVLVTLNSKGSIPPYMIVNRCRDVVIRLKQADYSRRSVSDSSACALWEDWDEILPSSNPMPFAWDEPCLRHVVKVVAYVEREAAPRQGDAFDVDLDAVDANCSIYVQSRSLRTLPLGSQVARGKFVTDNAKKVYVTVYADGPTRVLCFSEDRSGAANLDDENSLLNLSYRLQRVASRLKEVDRRLVQQLGSTLDLDIGPEQAVGHDGGSSQQAPTSTDEARRPVASGRGWTAVGVPRGVGVGFTAFRFGAVQAPVAAPSSGTSTPHVQLGGAGLIGQGSQVPFAFSRLQSAGGRGGNTYAASIPQSAFRNAPVASLAITNAAQWIYHTRTQSSQSYSAPSARLVPGLPPSADGLPPLFRTAPAAEDMSTQGLEALPAFGGDIDLPIGGDLTVVIRSVEGLSAGLNSNEKVVAIEGKMAVVASTPGRGDVKASWTQAIDQPVVSGAPASIDAGHGDGAAVVPGNSPGGPGQVAVLDHTQIFRDVAASSELRIDFYIAKGTEQSQVGAQVGQGFTHTAPSRGQQQIPRGTSLYGQGHAKSAGSTTDMSVAAHMHRLVVNGGQFAGCVRIPLMVTLGRDKSQVWRLPLERQAGSQLVRGYVSLSFDWSMTNEGMLVHEVSTLERILDDKLELLAQLKPLPISATVSFVRDPAAKQASTAARDSSAAAPVLAAPAAGMGIDGKSLSLGAGGAALATSRHLPAVKTAKALAESHYVNLEVSVLEISGLLPREGLRASIAASMYGRQTASVMSVAMLPRAVVAMACGGETWRVAAGSNSINPRFAKNKYTFENVPLGSKMELKVFDQVSKSYLKLLAEAEVHLTHIPGTDPIYAWLALARRKHGSRSQRVLALLMVMEEEGDVGVQLLVRIKINKPQVHGIGMAVTLDLAGIGLCAKTNLEELFNYTMQKMRTMLVQKRSELEVSLVVHTIQLDNQMLEAKNPVVLSPADVSGSSSLAQARRRHMAEFAQRFGRTNPILRSQDPSLRDPLLTCQVIYNQAGSNHAMVSSKGQEDSVGILAFRKVVLQLGPLDFSADQEFIEGVIAYLNGLPLQDFYQDNEWQNKIDTMQGGSMAPIGAAEYSIVRPVKSSDDVFAWLAAKEAKEFELLRGQSSMWFYLEELYLSDVFINVTLALSSSFNASGSVFSSTSDSGREDDRQRSMLRGFLSRVSGSNGFQLINVTNAPIQLEFVELKNHLVNRVSLINKLYRHYSWIALAQARKVLGGAGPAIAAIPASLLWASIALVDLGQDVAAKRVNPLVVPTRIGYVTFTLMGQVVGVLSRTMCALMGLMPPRFSSDNSNLSDSETARRFGIKPQTAVDALYLSQRDAVLGLMSAAFGVIHDTAAGARWKGSLVVLGVPMGLIKASLGLGIRPAAGAVEATSKILQGVGLACLGKRGIQGKLVRRVQAPGLAITDVVQAARASAAQAAMQAALIAAWQAALPTISSSLADDEVLDVVAARATRVVLLTDKHLAYLYARRHSAVASGSSTSSSPASGFGDGFTVTYRVKWIIRNDHIDNIRGLDRGYAVSVEYHKPVNLGRLSLKLPLHKGMRTATAEGHKDLIFRLNRHIGRAAHGGGFVSPRAAVAGEGAGYTDISVQGLRIMMPVHVDGGAQKATALQKSPR